MSDGNHGATVNGERLSTINNGGIEILHVPIRSYPQLERKIRQGSEALERNRRIGPGVGHSWRSLYNTHIKAGTLPRLLRRPPPR